MSGKEKKSWKKLGEEKVWNTLGQGVGDIEDKVPLPLVPCGDTHDSGTCQGKGHAYPPWSSLVFNREALRVSQSSEHSGWYSLPHFLRASLERTTDGSRKGVLPLFFPACEESDTGTNTWIEPPPPILSTPFLLCLSRWVAPSHLLLIHPKHIPGWVMEHHHKEMRRGNVPPLQMKLLKKQIHWGINSAVRTSEEAYLGLTVVRDWQQSEGQGADSVQVPPWLRQRGKKLRRGLTQLYQQLIRAPAPRPPPPANHWRSKLVVLLSPPWNKILSRALINLIRAHKTQSISACPNVSIFF